MNYQNGQKDHLWIFLLCVCEYFMDNWPKWFIVKYINKNLYALLYYNMLDLVAKKFFSMFLHVFEFL